MGRGKNLLITGNSSGLGEALTRCYLAQGWGVYGCSRRGCAEQAEPLQDIHCDLSDFDAIPSMLEVLLEPAEGLDLVILNAGILGELEAFHKVSLEAARQVMDVNLWANKVILDWLQGWGKPVRQIVAISSGAAVNGNKGWAGYALSKAALNMLIKLYAHEFPASHLSALAPGLIDTGMMEYLCSQPDPAEFPAVQRLRDSRDTGGTPPADEAAARIAAAIPHLYDYPSGEFVDIRTM